MNYMSTFDETGFRWSGVSGGWLCLEGSFSNYLIVWRHHLWPVALHHICIWLYICGYNPSLLKCSNEIHLKATTSDFNQVLILATPLDNSGTVSWSSLVLFRKLILLQQVLDLLRLPLTPVGPARWSSAPAATHRALLLPPEHSPKASDQVTPMNQVSNIEKDINPADGLFSYVSHIEPIKCFITS